MKCALVQIYRFAPEATLLRGMAEAFSRRGYRMILWSNREFGTVGLPMLPLSRGPEDDVLFDLKLPGEKLPPEFGEWEIFEKSWEARYGFHEPAYEPDRCSSLARLVFDRLNPDVFLCWCGFNPWFAIPRQEAAKRGIPVLIWEAGLLPQTLQLDAAGICGQSEWCDRNFPTPASNTRVAARAYLHEWDLSMRRVAGDDHQPHAKPGAAKRFLVLGSMDSANGVFAAPSLAKSTLPGYADGIDLAVAIALRHGGQTIYRPHPNEPELPLQRLSNTGVQIENGGSLEESLLRSDVIFGYGSKADMCALALGRPLVMCGRGMLTGKGCAYEALNPSELDDAMRKALESGQTYSQKESFQSFVASLLEHGHYNRQTAAPCVKGVTNLVEAVLLHSKDNEGGNFRSVLSKKGQIWWEAERLRYRFLRGCALECNAIADLEAGVARLPDYSRAILDFDHTLWLGNSTEQFIGTVEPRILGEIIDHCARRSWRPLRRLLSWEMDQWRVLLAIFFAPWSLILWRRNAAKSAAIFWNKPLYKLGTSGERPPPVIVSFGFRILIEPLVRAATTGTGNDNAPVLICSGLSSHRASLRHAGKVAAIERALPSFDWTRAFTISDSEEDRELLIRSKKGFLLQWLEAPHFYRPGYFPFRYVVKAKFPGCGYLKDLIIGQDLVVWLFVFATSLHTVPSALLLFLAIQCVYEIGYYENDHTASKREEHPTILATDRTYENYRIYPWAWILATVLGLCGCIIGHGAVNWIAPASFLATLAMLRLTYFVYNRTPARDRMGLYVLLQLWKILGAMFVLPMSAVGLVLAASHMFQHISIYQIYRCDGDKSHFRRAHMRLVAFTAGSLVLAASDIPYSPQLLAGAFVWCLYRSLVEAKGPRYSIYFLVHRFGWRLPKRISRTLRQRFRRESQVKFMIDSVN